MSPDVTVNAASIVSRNTLMTNERMRMANLAAPSVAARCNSSATTHGMVRRPMFVIELIYKAPLDKIDASMAAHMKFLKKHYAGGTFVVSGRKVPREGGVIIAAGDDRDAIEEIVRADPFVARGLADYRLIQFRASQRAADLPERIGD